MMKINEEKPVLFVNEKLGCCYETPKHSNTIRITDFTLLILYDHEKKDFAQPKRTQRASYVYT